MKVTNITSQLRSKILSTIKRREAQGWAFSAEVKEAAKAGNYQTLKSLYSGGNYRKLYDEAIAIDDITGEVITGTQASLRNRWSAETRIKNYTREMENKLRNDPAYQEAFAEGAILAERIGDLLGKLYMANDPCAGVLETAFTSLTNKLGVERRNVYLAQMTGEIMDNIALTLKYKHGYSYHTTGVNGLIDALTYNLEIDKLMTQKYGTGADVESEYVSHEDLWDITSEYRQYAETTSVFNARNASEVVSRLREVGQIV